jgi:TatD DNase family protein
MLHDAHNHLQDELLTPHLDRIARAAADAGIADMVVNGTHPDDWPRVEALATRFGFVRPAYGVHPWDAGNLRDDTWLGQLESRLAASPRASIGEIGLDRWILDDARPDDPRLAGVRRASLDEQTAVFLPQLALAARENLPATIHCLQAWGALDEVLRTHPVPARGFLLHAYAGPAELIPKFTALGAYFSFNAYFLKETPNPICHLISDKLPKTSRLEIFKTIPIDRILVETDAPAMPLPQAWRTHKLPPAPGGSPVNHPGNLDAAYAALASLRGVPLDELISQVTANFTRLFHP